MKYSIIVSEVFSLKKLIGDTIYIKIYLSYLKLKYLHLNSKKKRTVLHR